MIKMSRYLVFCEALAARRWPGDGQEIAGEWPGDDKKRPGNIVSGAQDWARIEAINPPLPPRFLGKRAILPPPLGVLGPRDPAK